MVSNKRFTGLWELIQLLWTIPIREFFHFHHLPKLYFGFNNVNFAIRLKGGDPAIYSNFLFWFYSLFETEFSQNNFIFIWVYRMDIIH